MGIFDGHGFASPSRIDSKEMLNYTTERSLDATFQGVWVSAHWILIHQWIWIYQVSGSGIKECQKTNLIPNLETNPAVEL